MATIKVPKKEEKKDQEQPDKKEESKGRIDDETGFWLNKTKSGKGVIIVIEDAAFISSLANVKEFIDGTRRGVKFSLLTPSED